MRERAIGVLKHFNAQRKAAFEATGRSHYRPCGPSKKTLRDIEARIKDHDVKASPDWDAVDGAKQVKRAIDVQAKDAIRAGRDKEANGWRYFTPEMFAYGDALAAKIGLWREDGEHQSYGDPRARRGARGRVRNTPQRAGFGILEDDSWEPTPMPKEAT